jgi:hypothetical protein
MQFTNASLLIAALVLTDPLFAQNQADAEVDADLREPEQPGFWRKLEFDDRRKLTSAKVVITEWAFLTGGREVVKKEFAVEDPKVLKLLERAIARARIPVPKKAGGLAGVLPTMRLELTTTNDKFNIQVFETSSFALSDKALSYDSHRQFDSTWLAYILDSELRKHGEKGLSELSLSALTGELSIKADTKQIKHLLEELDPTRSK